MGDISRVSDALTASDGVSAFRDLHKGETIYVVGSSNAWEWLDPAFFDDKVTVCMNRVAWAFGLPNHVYTVSQYYEIVEEARRKDWQGWVFAQPSNKYPGDKVSKLREHHKTILLPERTRSLDNFPDNVWPDNDNELLWGFTTQHMALYFAWFLGASTIVTVASDLGDWDGKLNGANYYPPSFQSNTRQNLRTWIKQTDRLAAEIRKRGTNVYTMLPTVNINLEGKKFSSPFVSIN